MMEKRVLDILDKHGFDWDGLGYEAFLIGIDLDDSKIIIGIKNEKVEIKLSLADIATNKSALDAAVNYFFSKESVALNKAKRRGDSKEDLIKELQLVLIKDLTNKEGKFWNILAEFMGISC